MHWVFPISKFWIRKKQIVREQNQLLMGPSREKRKGRPTTSPLSSRHRRLVANIPGSADIFECKDDFGRLLIGPRRLAKQDHGITTQHTLDASDTSRRENDWTSRGRSSCSHDFLLLYLFLVRWILVCQCNFYTIYYYVCEVMKQHLLSSRKQRQWLRKYCSTKMSPHASFKSIS
jgi:hypothetical protein